MFSLKHYARKNIRLVALGAAAASTACIATAALATSQDSIYWDPALTGTGTGSGGTGSFDNTTTNFWNPHEGVDTSIFWTGWRSSDGSNPDGTHNGYWAGDLVHFAGAAGVVTVNMPTNVQGISIDTNGYTINGANLIFGRGDNAATPDGTDIPVITVTTGNSTINATIDLPGTGQALDSVINVATGSTLTVGNIINSSGGYGADNKAGNGVLYVTGTFNTVSGGGDSGFSINAGTVILSGTGNRVGNNNGVLTNGFTNNILAGATLAGAATLTLPSGGSWAVAGNLAPGLNTPGSNFGGTGTLALVGQGTHYTVTLTATSHLELDLSTPDLNPDLSANTGVHDIFKMTGGEYGGANSLTIASGAVVDINNGAGTLVPGTYHIIELAASTNQHNPVVLTDGGLAVGIAPSGYTYSLVDLSGNAGIDLIVGVLAGSTWSATTGLGNWSNAANWTGSVPDSAGATATFGSGTVTTVNVDAPQTVGNIQFTGANNYSIGGATAGVITLDNSGSMSVVSVLGGTQAITSALVLNNAVEISNDPTGGTLNISGGITGTGNIVLKNKSTLTNALTLSGAAINNTGTITNNGIGSGSVLISAAIGSNVTGIIQASATSSLTLTGNSTSFAGTTTLSSGTLSFGNNSLGTTGTITFAGGTLQWAPGNSQDVSARFAATPSTINIDTNGNAVTFANPLTSTNTSTLNVSSTAAGGTLVLTGAQTYTGVTTINSGTLQLAPGASLNNTTAMPLVNAGGTLDINGNPTTIGLFNVGVLTNNGTVTNSGSHTTLTLDFGAQGTGAYTGNMDVVVIAGPGGNGSGAGVNLGTMNNTGTVTIGPTTAGFYGQVNVTTVGSNVTNVINNGRGGMTIGTLNTNSAGTTLTANLFTDGSYAPITVTNTVVGAGNLILAGPSPIALSGGINMAGTLINNLTYINGVNLVSVGSNVTAITQNSNSAAIRVNAGLVVNSGGTTLTSIGSAGLNIGGTVSGTGNLLIVNNSASVNVGVNALINNVGQIIVSGTSGGYVTLAGGAGTGIGSNVTGITNNSSTIGLTVSGYNNPTFTVNVAGTTITENGSHGGIAIDPAIVGTGNLNFVENGAANIFASALINNVGVVNVSGTGGGYVQLFGGIGSNVTAINQNSNTSFAIVAGITVASGGTTVSENGTGGIDLAPGSGIGGTGNFILKNNTAANNPFLLGAINNTGTFTNAGTGGGYVTLNPGIIGTNVTQVIQNSVTSALMLNGAQTYTAPTTVQLGTLIVNGSLASNVTVQSGGIASGNGSMPTLAVQSGGHVAPSGMGTLTTGTLNLASGAKLDYNFGTPGNNSSITVTGGASSLTLSSGVLLNALGSAATVGVGDYKLVGYGDTNAIAGWTDTTGSITGGVVSNSTPGTFLLGTGWSSAANLNYTITDNAANSGIFIDFTAGVAGGVPAGSGTWHNGTSDGKWTTNTGSGNNWLTGIPNAVDQVATFDDTAVGGAGTVDLNGNKTVGGIVLSTASAGYTLGLPSTTNTLTLQTSTGNASISVGGAASHTINALVNLASNTNVSFTAGGSLNMVGAVSGTGSLNLSGTGVLKLSAAAGNTYTGTNISGGTLLVANTSGSATGSSNVVMTGGTLGGSGTISGMVNASTGTVFPSATLSTTSTSTLTVGGLTTGAGTTLRFNLVTPGNSLNHTTSSSDRIAVTGSTLSLSGGAVNLTNHTTGAASLGFYKVIAFSGTISGTGLSSLSLPAVANNVSYVFDTTHDAGFIDIHRGFLGDVDDSGFVDINDLSILASNWQQAGGWAQGNFLGDPTVDINDLSVLAANWQTGVASFGDAADSLGDTSESFQQAVSSIVFGGAGSVPEPTSLSLLALAALPLLCRKPRPTQ